MGCLAKPRRAPQDTALLALRATCVTTEKKKQKRRKKDKEKNRGGRNPKKKSRRPVMCAPIFFEGTAPLGSGFEDPSPNRKKESQQTTKD